MRKNIFVAIFCLMAAMPFTVLAASESPKCDAKNGVCMTDDGTNKCTKTDTGNFKKGGHYEIGLCEGPAEYKCCVPNAESTAAGSGLLPTPGDKAHNVPPAALSSDANLGNYEVNDLLRLGVNITNWILGMVGSASLLMFIWGGFQWLISQGESAKIALGKKIMSSAVIGIVITFSSYIIIKFVIENVLGMSWSGGLVNF